MNIYELDVVGFRSITSRMVLKLNHTGVNIISGNNGDGKTQIWNALHWCLYGKPMNNSTEVETFKELRPEKYTGVRVAVKIKKDGHLYEIIKTKNFKGFDGKSKRSTSWQVNKNGEPLNLNKYSKDHKISIAYIIGISSRIFKNSIMFGQKLRRIIEEAGGEQKDFFTEAFEVDFIKEAKKKAEDRRTWLNSDLEPLLKKLDNAESGYEVNKKALLEDTKARKSFKDSQLDRLSIVRLQIQTAKEEIEVTRLKMSKMNHMGLKKHLRNLYKLTNDEAYKELALVKDKLTEAKYKLKDAEVVLAGLKKDLKFYDKPNEDKFICRICGNKLKKEKIAEIKEEEARTIKKIKNKIAIIQKDIEEGLKGSIKELEGEYSSISKSIEDKEPTKERIKRLEQRLNTYHLSKLKVQQNKTNIISLEKQADLISKEEYPTENRKAIKKRLRRFSNYKEIYSEKIEPIRKELELVDWVIKDPLSNKGLNNYIFNSMLKTLNERLRYYSSAVGFKIEFKIKMSSVRKEFYAEVVHRGAIKNYNALSGGEAQLVNIAIAFAMNDVINEQRNINLLVMDEAFESLDENNVEKVSSMIELKARGRCLWFITHLKSFEVTNARKYKVSFSKEKGTVIQ